MELENDYLNKLSMSLKPNERLGFSSADLYALAVVFAGLALFSASAMDPSIPYSGPGAWAITIILAVEAVIAFRYALSWGKRTRGRGREAFEGDSEPSAGSPKIIRLDTIRKRSKAA